MTHLILIQHFLTTFALKDRSNSEIIFHTNPIYLYESQELEQMCVSKPCYDFSHRHCTHDFHFVKSSIHLTRNSICHSPSCFSFIHILPLFLSSFVPHFSPFAASCAGFFSSSSVLRVEVVQSSVHMSLQFPPEGLLHSQNFKYYFCASKSNICISSSDFSPEIQNLPTYIRII